ncbi:MAG: MFS transporter, partial [Caldibacillus sp.]
MLGLKEWTGEALITKDFKLLLAIGAMYSLSVALSNTFVNVYIWKLTASYLQIGIYNLMIVIAQPV